MTFFGLSLIYILNLDAGWLSCVVFRLGWTAGRSALTIPTCDRLPIWHLLKPALSWPAVSDDCLSQDVVYMPASSLCLTSVPSPACHWASQQPVAKPALTSRHTRSPGHGARACPYEPAHDITWTRSCCPPFLNKSLFPSNPSVSYSLLDPVLSEHNKLNLPKLP